MALQLLRSTNLYINSDKIYPEFARSVSVPPARASSVPRPFNKPPAGHAPGNSGVPNKKPKMMRKMNSSGNMPHQQQQQKQNPMKGWTHY